MEEQLYYVVDDTTGEYIKVLPDMPTELLLALNYEMKTTSKEEEAAAFSEEEIEVFMLLETFPAKTKLKYAN